MSKNHLTLNQKMDIVAFLGTIGYYWMRKDYI